MASKKAGRATDGLMLGIHLDIGHSSIGWAVTEAAVPVVFRGCGTVLFPKDGCLASERRANRRQRRHIRSTRQRMRRLRVLLAHLGVLSDAELGRPGCAWPWKLAAEVFAQGRVLTWPELWDVVRWYAHNRGYDGNALWQRGSRPVEEDKETRESVENARHLMERHKTGTMAETICAVMGIKPGDAKRASMARYKASLASFPREVVQGELVRILTAHAAKLPGVDEHLIRALAGSATSDPGAWKAVDCPGIKLPARYAGGLLFGQLVPRFDNRIIGRCPLSNDKKPLKNCAEFLEYRWAMLLANVRVTRQGPPELTAVERKLVTAALREQGYFTKGTFKKAMQEATGSSDSNIDNMMLSPDAENALELYPAVRETKLKEMAAVWDVLPANVQRRVLKRLSKGKSLTLREIREWVEEKAEFDRRIDEVKKGKKKASDPLAKVFKADFPTGRAPYSRAVMRQAVAEVMDGKDPRMEGGILYLASRERCLCEDEIDRETNNHLVRNRLRVVRRLVEDIVKEYAGGDRSLISAVTIELNREVKDLSGKTAKQIASDMGLRLKTHSAAAEYAATALEVPKYKVGGSLIRKVRIAMDLDWTCPYTLAKYDIHQLVDGSVDLDHIIPRSQRLSDSLDSLVVTFKSINAWKSDATACDFVQMHGGKPVPGMPNLSIISPNRYEELVGELKKKKMPHTDDQRRRDNRCKRLMTRGAEDGKTGFTPRDLTVSSHLTTLASAVIRDAFSGEPNGPSIRLIPGRITKEVRMGFNLLGTLARVNPEVLNEEGRLKTKTEIRDVSHLHHAVDAMTLGLASTLIPADGSVWGAMLKRRPLDHERSWLEKTGVFQFDASGRPGLRPLDPETLESAQRCICECRVATHMRASKRGAALEKTIWGIVAQDGDTVELRQQTRDKDGLITRKSQTVNVKRVLGISPRGESKLKPIKGAIIISDNFGVALDPEPEVIPFHQVWRRLGEIKKRNNGVMPRVLRNGMLIRVAKGRYEGAWKIFSVKDDQRMGVVLDMGAPDVVTLKDKTPGHKRNIRLSTLMKDGLDICAGGYTGVVRDVPPPG